MLKLSLSEDYLRNGKFGYFTLGENNTLDLHGFTGLRTAEFVYIREAENKLYLVIGDKEMKEKKPTLKTFCFDGSAQKDEKLIAVLNMTRSINCLFVETMGMYMQLPNLMVD